jgi:hypothetical protein
MRLSAAAIQEFKAIWRDEYGEELSDAEAETHALRLLRLFALLVRPLPSEGHPHRGEAEHFDKFPDPRTMEEGSHVID